MDDLTNRCGATTRSGQPCRRWPGPNGRCRLHGGASTGPRTLAGRVACSQAAMTHGRYSRWMRDPHGAALAVAADLATDPLAAPDLSDQLILARSIQALARDSLPREIDPDQAVAIIVAIMPHIIRAAEAHDRIEEHRERRRQAAAATAAVAGALPTPVSEATPISEADRLRQWAAELESEAKQVDLWPDGSCGEVCRQLVELADSFDGKNTGARGR